MVMEDFKLIRWSVYAAALMALAGAGTVLFSHHMLAAERHAHQQALAAQADIHARLARVAEEAQDARGHAARFAALVERGVIGTERRLEWVEQMRRAKAARKLYDLQFEIAPQQAIEAALLPGSSGDYEFRSSAMRLHMHLLHEGDLLGFIGDLRDGAHAYLRPRSCVVERLAPSASEAPGRATAVGPQLRADCIIDWITIQQRGTAAPTG